VFVFALWRVTCLPPPLQTEQVGSQARGLYPSVPATQDAAGQAGVKCGRGGGNPTDAKPWLGQSVARTTSLSIPHSLPPSPVPILPGNLPVDMLPTVCETLPLESSRTTYPCRVGSLRCPFGLLHSVFPFCRQISLNDVQFVFARGKKGGGEAR
jgi:hypothetical protein